MTDTMLNKLDKMKVMPLGEYDKDLNLSWFIVKECIEKRTKNGKLYWLLKTIDSSNKMNTIKCWGINPQKDKVIPNRAYMARLEHSPKWGFSTRSFYHNFKLL